MTASMNQETYFPGFHAVTLSTRTFHGAKTVIRHHATSKDSVSGPQLMGDTPVHTTSIHQDGMTDVMKGCAMELPVRE